MIRLSRIFLKRALIWAAIVVAAYTLLGFVALPLILKAVLPSQLGKALHRHVSVEQVRFNPYTLGLTVRGVHVDDIQGKSLFASVGEIYLDLRASSLFRLTLILSPVRISKPYVAVVRLKNGSYNFQDLLASGGGKPLRFSLNNLQITEGSVDFQDLLKDARHTVRNMAINIPFISNVPRYADVSIHPLFSAVIDGASYEITGRTKPFATSLETEVRLTAGRIDLPHYLSYLPPSIGIKVPSGLLDLDLTISYSQHEAKEPTLLIGGRMGLERLAVHDLHDAPLLQLPRMEMAITSAEVFSRTVHIGRLSLDAPRVDIARDAAGNLSILSVISPEARKGNAPAAASKEGSPAAANQAPPFHLLVDEVALTHGKVTFADSLPEKGFRAVLDPVDFRLSHFSTEKGKAASFSLSIKTDAGEQVQGEGTFSVYPVVAEGHMALKSLTINRYAPYYSGLARVSVQKGQLDLSSRYRYEEKEKKLLLSGIDVALSNLALREEGAPADFLVVPALSLSNGEVDMAQRLVTLGEVSTERGALRVLRSKEGRINLLSLLPEEAKPAGGTTRPPAGAAQTAQAWVVKVSQARVRGYTVEMEDRSVAGPVRMQMTNIEITGRDLSTEKGARARIAFSSTLMNKGSISVRALVGMSPLSARARAVVKNVALAPFQPYMPDTVSLAIEGGAVSAQGDLSLGQARDGGMSFTYTGSASATDFSSTDSVTGNRFLAWKSLTADGVSAGYNPVSLTVPNVSLNGLYVRLGIGQDGVFNVQHILKSGQTGQNQAAAPPAGPAPHASSGQPVARIDVGTVTLQNGTADFSDQFIKPPYSARLSQMTGTVSGIAAGAKEPARVDAERTDQRLRAAAGDRQVRSVSPGHLCRRDRIGKRPGPYLHVALLHPLRRLCDPERGVDAQCQVSPGEQEA